ncbi:MAG: pilus assembly protein PilM [Kiritimatiellia bacterium]
MRDRASRNESGQRRVVAIEIGGDWLKIVQFERTGRYIVASQLGMERFETLDDSVAETLVSLRDSMKIGKGSVIVSLPRHMVTTRMLELPSTDPDEIADMVDLQTAKLTPYSRTEVVFDYRTLGSSREGYTRILLGIAQRQVVAERFHLVEKSGFTVERMALSSEGVLAWYQQALQPPFGAAGTDIVLDVDSTHSDFLVLVGGELLFTRSISIGANHLLSDSRSWTEKLAEEIRQALESFRGEHPDVIPGRLILSGAAPNLSGLHVTLGSAVGIATECRSSLAAVRQWPTTPSMGTEQYKAVSLTALIGMGLAPQKLQSNLTPESVVLKRNLARKAANLTTFASLVMAMLISLSAVTTLNLCFRISLLNRLRSEREEVQGVAENVERKVELIKLVRERRDTKCTPVTVLTELAAMVPRGEVVFDTVRIDAENRQIVLQGMGTSRNIIRTLVQNLEKSPIFVDVKEGGATVGDRSGRFRFLVNARLESEP